MALHLPQHFLLDHHPVCWIIRTVSTGTSTWRGHMPAPPGSPLPPSLREERRSQAQGTTPPMSQDNAPFLEDSKDHTAPLPLPKQPDLGGSLHRAGFVLSQGHCSVVMEALL